MSDDDAIRFAHGDESADDYEFYWIDQRQADAAFAAQERAATPSDASCVDEDPDLPVLGGQS